MLNVLFDLDGTLTDPGDGFVACVRYALSALRREPIPDAEIRKHVGPPLQETLGRLLGSDPDGIAAAVELYRERYGSRGLLENRVYPGIEAALHALAAGGATMYVATSKPVEFAEPILAHFGLRRFFKGVFGSLPDGTHSDKKQLIAHLLSSEALAPAATLMIGDRAQDVLAARANAVRPIGALWGYGSLRELTDAGAAVVCSHPTLLPGIVLGARAMRPAERRP